MSPSAAIKTSSFWDKNTFFVSPGRLAKPKNLSVIGGGGGIGGGRPTPACLSLPFALGFSIGTNPPTKIFLPFPPYFLSPLFLRTFTSRPRSPHASPPDT